MLEKIYHNCILCSTFFCRCYNIKLRKKQEKNPTTKSINVATYLFLEGKELSQLHGFPFRNKCLGNLNFKAASTKSTNTQSEFPTNDYYGSDEKNH